MAVRNMHRCSSWSLPKFLVATVLMSACMGAGSASAQDAGTPGGSCFQVPAAASQAELDEFLGNPNGLLQQYPGAGLGLSSDARALAGTDADTVPVLIGLAAVASPAQQAAIAAGLAQAAAACAAQRPDFAAYIQEQIALSGQQLLIAAFIAASGDVETAALGGGGAIGGGIGGGTTGGAIGGAAGTGGSNSSTVSTSSGGSSNFSFGGGGGSFTENARTTVVSPTQ